MIINKEIARSWAAGLFDARGFQFENRLELGLKQPDRSLLEYFQEAVEGKGEIMSDSLWITDDASAIIDLIGPHSVKLGFISKTATIK